MKPVTVTLWPAKDGSLHDTEVGATHRNNWILRAVKIEAVRGVVERKVRNHHFSGLDKLFPYNGYARTDEYKQNKFLDDLAELIIDSLSDITEAYVTAI